MKQELKFRERGVSAARALEVMSWVAGQTDQSQFWITIQSPSLGGLHPYDISIDFKENEDLALEFKLLFCEEV